MKRTSNIATAINRIQAATDKAVEKTAVKVIQNMTSSFAEVKTGRIYSYGQASAPGEAPGIKDGDLLNSLTEEPIGDGVHRVGSTDKKAPALEYGTSRIAPRPFLTPAVLPAGKDLEKNIKKELKKL
ncbi:MAG: hypothetical protein ACR2MD_01055 [Aridibacter sp.]